VTRTCGATSSRATAAGDSLCDGLRRSVALVEEGAAKQMGDSEDELDLELEASFQAGQAAAAAAVDRPDQEEGLLRGRPIKREQKGA